MHIHIITSAIAETACVMVRSVIR